MKSPRRVSGPPQQVTRTGGPKKPGCPKHFGEMRFDPNVMAWKCIEPDCAMVAYPREDFESGKGKPHVGQGILEAVVHGGRTYLRAPDNNVMLDVTDYLRRLDDQMPSHYDITLRLKNITTLEA